MNYGLYLSASGVLTGMYRQDVFANNLANVQTAGFKPDVATIRQRLPQSQTGFNAHLRNHLLDAIGGGSLAGPQSINFEPGGLEKTGDPLDVALTQKNAFFVVGAADSAGGQTSQRLTRDGRFTQNAKGELVMTTTGLPVLDTGNRPITFSGSGPVHIDSQGRVMQGEEQIARLQVASVDNLSQLTKEGRELMHFNGPVGGQHQLNDPMLASGHIEGSGVNPVQEMVAMLNAARDVTNNANMIHYHDQMMDRAINTLGRVA